jgi:hypothetical protein
MVALPMRSRLSRKRRETGTPVAVFRIMKPAQVEALAGTGLLLFSAFRRGPIGILAFLAATFVIVHAASSRVVDAVKKP